MKIIKPPSFYPLSSLKRKLIFAGFICLCCCHFSNAQIRRGKITYERKTNLYKKYKGDEREWIKEEDKIKVDVFELYFSDSLSAFKPQESELKEKLSWTTSKNYVYQNFSSNKKLSIKTVWGEKIYIADSLSKRTWKITDQTRNIAGFNCRKAIWQVNDSTKVYAWYCNEIEISTGPESFNGLPGLILGLAAEDGGVIYFAKKVELVNPAPNQLLTEYSRQKTFTSAELKIKLEKDFGKERWGKAMIKEVCSFW